MDGQEPLIKPRSVILAVRLIYATIGISIVWTLFWCVFWLSGLIGEVSSPVCGFTVLILVNAGFLFLATKISQGRNWARTLFLVLFFLGFLGSICSVFPLSQYSQETPYAILTSLSTLSNIAISLVNVVAVIFLFKSDSNEYFKAQSKRKKQTS